MRREVIPTMLKGPLGRLPMPIIFAILALPATSSSFGVRSCILAPPSGACRRSPPPCSETCARRGSPIVLTEVRQPKGSRQLQARGIDQTGRANQRPPQDTTATGPSGPEIGEWHYIGPFSVGAREGIIGIADDPAYLRPLPGTRYPSTMVQGGYVEWKSARADSAGWVTIEFADVLWDTLMDVYGFAGVLNGAYAYGEIAMPAEARVLIGAERIGSFYLNGDLHMGDPYGHGFVKIPVVLSKGINRIVVALTGYGDQRFRFDISPAGPPLVVPDDLTLPDILRGDTGEFWAGVPLLNTTAEWLEDIRILTGDGGSGWGPVTVVRRLAPLCVKKVPVRLAIDASYLLDRGVTDTLRVAILIEYGAGVLRDTLALRIRDPGQSYRRTFVSYIDSSCQYYAVQPPTELDPAGEYGLILTLHGANVRAEGQADAYKSKSWAFVIAPTNRRPFGFDWQDWGRLDALEVLELAKRSLPVDTSEVYLTGHSMGGHGVWHVGLSHPDLFAAMAPGAGWTNFELYIPWFLQRGYIFGSPAKLAIRDMALRQDWPLDFVENAFDLPIFILQGGADDNVPPVHARMFVGRLDELGYEYTYKEVPGKPHWWNIDSLDVACVDDPDLIGYLNGKRRDLAPRHIRFKTLNIGHSNRAYWIRLNKQGVPFRETAVEADAWQDTIRITTLNVADLAVSVNTDLVPGNKASLCIDGRCWQLNLAARREYRFSKRAGEFRLGGMEDRLAKTHGLYGPMKQAYFTPFVLVYGTRGDPSTTASLLSQARLEAFRWWRRANGCVDVLPDTLVGAGVISTRNLILFGGPEENKITEAINRDLPVRSLGGKLYVGEREIKGSGLAAKFIYPNPLNPRKFVVVNEGTDREGLMLTASFAVAYAGAGLPDFMVFDRSVRRIGWGGVVAAGYFDSEWRLDRTLMFLE